ncbi:GNAT family N-acetyltransferase [Dysgonomonas sp. 25]|uniref:GNAT family N-acetyltransferase n=1 Tax=Dysgonomonas sp. 25 TaxID=2302933 RepID=UPI0013D53159|nr:GNAT family N-acetyltransferase [Dysgonomonas sp. 25]NDV68873.1 N-acetyltransferase family protein [Dysgonomonas sp. 25]
MIRGVQAADATQIAGIYNHYIENTVVTFEEEPLTSSEMQNRITSVLAKGYPYLVYEEGGKICGFAYLNTWRARSAFDITLESSIYIAPEAQGKGLGKELYTCLINKAKEINLHSIIAAISLPNDISRQLHREAGFELVGNFKEAGRKFGQLIDCEFWQLFLQSNK